MKSLKSFTGNKSRPFFPPRSNHQSNWKKRDRLEKKRKNFGFSTSASIFNIEFLSNLFPPGNTVCERTTYIHVERTFILPPTSVCRLKNRQFYLLEFIDSLY